jgi:molybdenum cofactor synthesis domain-containing protein
MKKSLVKIKAENAVGTILAHDITRIIPGKFKGVGFKKGHILKKEDIPELLKIGKEHIYVLNLSEDQLHEDDAALRIAPAICGDNLAWTEPSEGKSTIVSQQAGLLKVNVRGLTRINKLGNIIVSTLKTNFPCQKGQKVAATRIIPLMIAKTKIEKLVSLAVRHRPILQLTPFRKLRVGGVVTGSEISKGLIKDEFDQYVGKKVSDYGCEFVKKIIVPDEPKLIANAVLDLKDLGCDLILTTGGLSVDPDDVTKLGVKKTGAKMVAYGSPVLPGAMFLCALLDNTTILGLPACVFYHPTTIYDLILPRVLAGENITKNEIADMGHGGLCLECETCRFPNCSFGK